MWRWLKRFSCLGRRPEWWPPGWRRPSLASTTRWFKRWQAWALNSNLTGHGYIHPFGEVMEILVLEDIGVYITLHRNTVAQYIATHPIMDLFPVAERRSGNAALAEMVGASHSRYPKDKSGARRSGDGGIDWDRGVGNRDRLGYGRVSGWRTNRETREDQAETCWRINKCST